MTNLTYIRQMPLDELAEYLGHLKGGWREDGDYSDLFAEKFAEWLIQEAQDKKLFRDNVWVTSNDIAEYRLRGRVKR